MTTAGSPTYVGVGRIFTESVTSKLTTIGARYVHKLLNSRPENWERIAEIIGDEDVTGVILKLTGRDYSRICSDEYRQAATHLLQQLEKKPHLVLVHEAVAGYLTPAAEEDDPNRLEDHDYDYWDDITARERFGDVPIEVREVVHGLLDDQGIEFTTYKRNAEASALAASFIEDASSNLLFRFYIPAGRIYEEEIARVLRLFHDWLGSVAGQNVRQDSYHTQSGRVIEFFGEPGTTPSTWSEDFAQFSKFLTLVDDRDAAVRELQAAGLSKTRAEELTARYRREANRIQLDTRHERERRMLQIRQELESDLSEETILTPTELSVLVDQLVPPGPTIEPQGLRLLHGTGSNPIPPTIVIENQQIISHVQGVVAQNLAGPVNIGTSHEEILEIIREIGGPKADEAQVAVRELADKDAPPTARSKARQWLKTFLIRNAERIEKVAFEAAMRWVEGQIG